jgi:hypothetical protein
MQDELEMHIYVCLDFSILDTAGKATVTLDPGSDTDTGRDTVIARVIHHSSAAENSGFLGVRNSSEIHTLIYYTIIHMFILQPYSSRDSSLDNKNRRIRMDKIFTLQIVSNRDI